MSRREFENADQSGEKPRLIVISAVHPFPGSSGQQQRVRHKLLAFREHFHTTFLTVAALAEVDWVADELKPLCEESIVLPSRYRRSRIHRLVHRVASVLYAAATGLKRSNYIMGRVELAPERTRSAIGDRRFDVAVFEYWHAVGAVPFMQAAGARCVLDMHDVLWLSYERQLQDRAWIPSLIRDLTVARYRAREESAWRGFDALITINREEHGYVGRVLGDSVELIYAPMGIDLRSWPYSWAAAAPPRVAYYGSLGSTHNLRDAMFCFEEVMPEVWRHVPEAEFWIVGSNPPPSMLQLASASRQVHVTGYLEDVSEVLATVSAVLCPWKGRFGFRSRVVEVSAIGAPVIASHDAVHGMELRPDEDLLIADSPLGMAKAILRLLGDPDLGVRLSRSARRRVEDLYSYDSTYSKLARSLASSVEKTPTSKSTGHDETRNCGGIVAR